jgi:hypothetical protein
MTRHKMIIVARLVLCFLCSQTLSGCAIFPLTIVAGTSPDRQAMAQTDLPELAQRELVIDTAARIGESLGYQVSVKTDDMVVLKYETSEFREPITGEYQFVRIFVYRVKPATLKDLPPCPDQELERIVRKIAPPPSQEETVHLAVYSGGAYLAGSQESVDLILKEFKSRLLRLTPPLPPGEALGNQKSPKPESSC